MPSKKIERVCPGCGKKKVFPRENTYCSDTCYNRLRAEKAQDAQVAGAAQESFRPELKEVNDITKDKWTIVMPKTRIHTLQQLLDFCKVDLGVWEVERFIANKWEMGYKDNCGEPGVVPLYQIKAFLRRKRIPAEHESYDLDKAAARFRELIGNLKKPSSPPIAKKSTDVVWAAFSDPHCPYLNEDFFGWALNDAKRRGATKAVVPGDLFDLFAFSRFDKYEHVPVQKELAAGKLFLNTLSEHFEEVHVIRGNHDERAKKYFAKAVQAEFMFLVNWNIVEIAAADLPNVKLPCLKIQGRELPFLWQEGDLILGHPETSSKTPMKAVDTFAAWLNQWQETLDLRRIRVVGQGHTHQAGGPVILATGIAVFELGCCCKLPDYVFDPKLRYRPQTNAYGLFVQRDGKTDLNESGLFFRGGTTRK